jgi:5S rRNA maturation endonuclease (ribonuclease M5)
LGFLRGVLSNKYYDWALSGRVYSWNDTLKWAQLFLEGRPIEIEKAVTQEKLLGGIPKDLIKFRLKIPALTLIKRGFSSDVLIRYSVGTCEDCKKPMYRREVVPIYDQLYRECVGCTGRSVFDECKRCGAFHSEMMPCSLINKKVYTKWKHSKGFKKGQHLYNSWFALPHIKKTDSCILVEGPLDVLKLEMAGIRNGLATFGARISDQQQIILESWSISRVVCLFDNDEAGVKGREQVRKKLKKSHKLVFPEFVGHDVGELTIEQVKGIRYG